MKVGVLIAVEFRLCLPWTCSSLQHLSRSVWVIILKKRFPYLSWKTNKPTTLKIKFFFFECSHRISVPGPCWEGTSRKWDWGRGGDGLAPFSKLVTAEAPCLVLNRLQIHWKPHTKAHWIPGRFSAGQVECPEDRKKISLYKISF